MAWLQSLLRERFHEELNLRPTCSGDHEISVPGSEHNIRIRTGFGCFRHGSGDLPCGQWTPGPSPWLAHLPHRMPTPGMARPPARMIERDDQGYVLHYDVLALAWWMFSRYEEVDSKRLDEHGRFPAEASHAFRHGYLERPIVDEWFQVLEAVIRAIWPELPLREHRYSLQLSHDVDTPARYAFVSAPRLALTMLVDLLRDRHRDRQALRKAPQIWAGSRQRLDARDPFNTFDWIMDRSEPAGLRNAFYFICGHTDPRRDGHYFPEHPAIVGLMQRIHARGHEIGLHPSYHTCRDPAALLAEAQRLRATCRQAGIPLESFGARMHYLRWHTPETLHGQQAAGIVYDTTLGYAKHPGFRCGTCHEYAAFDPVRNEAMKLRIRPLIVMESTVMRPLGRENIDVVEAWLRKLMQACHRVKGQFTLLWHNTMLEQPMQRELYERVLRRHKELA